MVRYIKLSVTLTIFLSALLLSGFGEGLSPTRAVEGVLAAEAPAPLAVCTLEPGLVAYWRLDDGAGAMTFDDVLDNPPEHPGHPATCLAGKCPDSTSGKVNTAFSFGSSDQVTVADADDFDFGIEDSFSIELWAKTAQVCPPPLPEEDPALNNKVFIGKHSFSSSWWVGCSNDTATFSLRSSVGTATVISDVTDPIVPIHDDAWHHVVAVREFTGLGPGEGINRLYVDGIEVATATRIYTGTFANDNQLTIGFHDNRYNYEGVLDEVAIYNQALSPDDILAHYNAGTGLSYCDEPLRVTDPGDQVDDEDSTIEALQIEHTPTGTTIASYSATGLPDGLDINTTTGEITGSLDFDANTSSPYTVIVTATSNAEPPEIDITEFTWIVNNVNRAPEITVPGTLSNDEGETITPLQITATDPDGDQVTFTALNLPPGLSIDSSGLITGTIAYNAFESGPSYTVEVTATDNGTPTAESTTDNFTWEISNVNQAPDVTNPGNRTNEVGDTVSLQIAATDPDGDDLTYTATGLPDGLGIGLNSGLISGVLTSNSIGVHDVVVTVSDGFVGNDVPVAFTWTVTAIDNAPPVVTNPGNKTNKERDPVSLQIVATDEDGDDLTYTATGLPDGLSINLNTGLISGVLSLSSAGVHTVLVTVSDGNEGNGQTVQFTWTVTNVYFVFLPVVSQGNP